MDLVTKIILPLVQDKLAFNITTEQGKTLKDAHGDVFRGLGLYVYFVYLSTFHSTILLDLISDDRAL